MTPATVSNIVQAPSLFTAGKSKLPSQPEEKSANTPGNGSSFTKDSAPAPVDTISISSLSRGSAPVVKKEEVKKEATATVAAVDNSEKAAAKVQFVYDLKGELITKYLDSSNRLVYQVPSELMVRLKESVLKADTTVDTKA